MVSDIEGSIRIPAMDNLNPISSKYGKNYVDVNVNSRSGNLIHVSNASELSKRGERERIVQHHNHDVEKEPRKELQIDSNGSECAYLTTSNLDSLLRNEHESASSLQNEQQPRKGTRMNDPGRVRIVVRVIRDLPKKLYRSAKNVWNMLKTLFIMKNRNQSTMLESTASNEQNGELLPTQSTVNDETKMDDDEEEEQKIEGCTQVPDRVSRQLTRSRFDANRLNHSNVSHNEAGLKVFLADVHDSDYSKAIATIPESMKTDDIVLDKQAPSSAPSRNQTMEMDHSDHIMKLTEKPTPHCTKFIVHESIVEKGHTRPRIVQELEMKYGEDANRIKDMSVPAPEILHTKSIERFDLVVFRTPPEQVVHEAFSNKTFKMHINSFQDESEEADLSAARLASRKGSSFSNETSSGFTALPVSELIHIFEKKASMDDPSKEKLFSDHPQVSPTCSGGVTANLERNGSSVRTCSNLSVFHRSSNEVTNQFSGSCLRGTISPPESSFHDSQRTNLDSIRVKEAHDVSNVKQSSPLAAHVSSKISELASIFGGAIYTVSTLPQSNSFNQEKIAGLSSKPRMLSAFSSDSETSQDLSFDCSKLKGGVATSIRRYE